ncbi:MAG: AccI family restriction endonuclease, partial [Bacteroides sp.]|nr:AccI family restriction endonuclease [Bacteroides sp.]
AEAGNEVRASAFLIEHYEEAMRVRSERYTQLALNIKNEILSAYRDVLSHPSREAYIKLLEGLNADTLQITGLKVPGWRSTPRLCELNELFKRLRAAIKEVQKRDYLSITPKVEDIKVVYKWIETFNVPHYYFQVFFDKVYALLRSTNLSTKVCVRRWSGDDCCFMSLSREGWPIWTLRI